MGCRKNGNVKKNTVYNMIKTVSTVLFPLIVFPYTSRVLQPENLGRINFVTSIISYISLIASLGIATYAVRECAKVRENRKDLDCISSQIFSINIVSTLSAFVVLGIVIASVNKLRNESNLVWVYAIPIIFQLLGADWINTAMADLKYITIRTVVFQFLSVILIFLFVKEQGDYIVFAVISAIASIGANILNMIHRRKYCRMIPTINIDFRKHLKPIMALFVLTFSQTIFLNIDTTMIGFFNGNEDVGLYSVAVKIYNLASTFISAISIVVIPQLSLYRSKDMRGKVKQTQQFALDYILTLGIPIIFGINLFTYEIIDLISGSSYISAVPVLHILSIALCIVSFGGAFVGNIVLLPSGKENIFMQASVIATITNIVLNLIFIPLFGIVAAACTTVISELTILIILFYKGRDEIVTGLSRKSFFQPLAASASFILVKMITNLFMKTSVLNTLIRIIICFILYLLLLIIQKNKFLMEYLKPIMCKWRKEND